MEEVATFWVQRNAGGDSMRGKRTLGFRTGPTFLQWSPPYLCFSRGCRGQGRGSALFTRALQSRWELVTNAMFYSSTLCLL